MGWFRPLAADRRQKVRRQVIRRQPVYGAGVWVTRRPDGADVFIEQRKGRGRRRDDR